MSDTIIALASGNAKAGVAIIRVSGGNAIELARIFTNNKKLVPRYCHFHEFRDVSGELLDSGIIIYFPAPNSFTGEDVIEFQIHGSHAITKRFIEAAIETKLVRLAAPGEFSKRAFLNDKMDLSQVEGLLDLIDAETELQRRQAIRILNGELGDKTAQWRESIVTILAEAEAYIDFPDEDLPDGLSQNNRARIINLIDELNIAISNSNGSNIIRDGFTIVIIGAPNVGKSSLLNALCRQDAAIVSSIAGTTRDIIEVSLNLEGYLVHLNDTAGLRDASDLIEKEGIRRALERCEKADLIIGLVEDENQIRDIEPHLNEDSFLIWSKSDIFGNRNSKECNLSQINISASLNEGIVELEQLIISRIREKSQLSEAVPLTRLRHKLAICDAIDALEKSLNSSEMALELGCEDLRYASFRLGEIVGKVGMDDLLDKIFSSFCIGK